MQTTPPLEVGRTLDLGYGRVVVDARLGQGAMGAVYRAWLFFAPNGPRGKDPALAVALKELLPGSEVHPTLVQFFRNEAEAMRRLDHPNVVRFFDMIQSGRSLAIIMEYVEGGTLEQVITRSVARAQLAGPGALPGMPFQRAWYYFQQLLGALAVTHALGLVHRDVKPANILIRKDGIVKLGDWGIAHFRNTSEKPSLPGVPPPADVIAPGTGVYMSPEQVLARPIDGRSDLYSAAIVLFEMLTGRTPISIEGKTELQVRVEQVQRSPPPIRTWLAQAPPVLDALFARALAKDPSYRFADAIEMGESFRAALELPDTPAWRAQADFAREAAAPHAGGVAVSSFAPPALEAAPAPAPAPTEPTATDVEEPRETTAVLMQSAPPPMPLPSRVRTLREFLIHNYSKTQIGH